MILMIRMAIRNPIGSLIIGVPGEMARKKVPTTSIPILIKFIVAEALALSCEVIVAILAPFPQ
jgi:hypothetical protein